MEAADKLSVVGDKLTALGGKAVEVYSDAENAVTEVTAYFDETGKAAETTAAVINDVYGSGVGDSMDSVAEGVLAAKKNLGDLSQTDLTNITQQAMNCIVKGTQNGLDKTNELGDNLSEYAGKFSQIGCSASEYFQLLDNGLKGGAYNLDKVNDAINEVTTRLADGTIGGSLDLYSEKTKNIFTEWQNGKATQKDVIDSIVADISGCTSQQEALNMAAGIDSELYYYTWNTDGGIYSHRPGDSGSGGCKYGIEYFTPPNDWNYSCCGSSYSGHHCSCFRI